MAKYIDADLLRKELERRITDNTFGAKLELIDILAWLDSLSEEPNKSLEEAAEKYATEWRQNPDGSAWKPYFEKSAIKAFKAGAEWQKNQMMKEAVEGYVTLTLTGVRTVAATIKEGDNIGISEKVRIIIVKEGEK